MGLVGCAGFVGCVLLVVLRGTKGGRCTADGFATASVEGLRIVLMFALLLASANGCLPLARAPDIVVVV